MSPRGRASSSMWRCPKTCSNKRGDRNGCGPKIIERKQMSLKTKSRTRRCCSLNVNGASKNISNGYISPVIKIDQNIHVENNNCFCTRRFIHLMQKWRMLISINLTSSTKPALVDYLLLPASKGVGTGPHFVTIPGRIIRCDVIDQRSFHCDLNNQ